MFFFALCDTEHYSSGLPESSADAAAEKAVIFVIDDLVTFADGIFQALPVNQDNCPTSVCDQTFFSEFLGGERNSFAAHTEHIGDKVVRHNQFIRI